MEDARGERTRHFHCLYDILGVSMSDSGVMGESAYNALQPEEAKRLAKADKRVSSALFVAQVVSRSARALLM